MKNTIETRELIVLDGLIRGTYHRPSDCALRAQSGPIERGRVGVLFLNSLSPTRAAHGDSAVYWADAFAERGYPSFRLDLPGFGDSDGDTPTELLGFIERGGYASTIAAKINELVARFNLSGVAIVGHCAGAVSAIYTAAASEKCRGLVLLDPYFHLSHTIQPKTRAQLRFWILQSRLGRLFSNILDPLKGIYLSFRDTPPENANLPLLRRWKELASTGLPVLILMAPNRKAPGMKPRVGEFDYFRYILGLAGGGSRVAAKSMDGADHSFASRQGRAAVRQHIEDWLNAFFPLTENITVNTLHRRPDESDCHSGGRENCLQR